MRTFGAAFVLVLALGLPAVALASATPVLSGSVANAGNLSGATSADVSGNYAYTTAYYAGQLTAVDISNPASPAVAGTSATASSLLDATNIAISGGYAYVVSKNRNASTTNNDDGTGNSLTILDTHSNPATPAIVGALHDATNLFGAYGIAVSGIHAYVAAQGCLSGQPCPNAAVGNSFAVVDTSNPASPTLVGTLHNGSLPSPWNGSNALDHATSVAISGNDAYVTAAYSNRLTVLDISNPASPTIVASLQDNTHLNFPVDVAVQGNYAYVACQGGGPGLAIVNISNPSAPKVVATLSNSSLGGAYRIRVSGDFAYISGSSSMAMSVVDVSNPANPILAWSDTDPTHFWHTTGLSLDSTNQHLIAVSPSQSGQTGVYPPFPGQSGGPTDTGTVSAITLEPTPIAVSITATSEPLLTTTATSADFQFQTSNPVEAVQCELDGNGFGPCTTPASEGYTSLLVGSHTFTVEGIDSAGNTVSSSYTWTIDSGGSVANSAPPAISGAAAQAQTLTASLGTWSATPPPTFTVQWQRCNAAGASCGPIPGATGNTYTLGLADVGSRVRVAVTATAGTASAIASSTLTAVIAAAPSTGGPPVVVVAGPTTPTTTAGGASKGAGGTGTTAPRPSGQAGPVGAIITRLTLAKVDGRYRLYVRLKNAGTVTITVRSIKPRRGPILERLRHRARAGSSRLTLVFHAVSGSKYLVVVTTSHGSKRLTFSVGRSP